MGTVSKVMAGCFSMAAFAVAIIAGLTSGNPAILVLGRALVAMILCYPIGYVIGIVCERVIALHVGEYEKRHPVPADEEDGNDADATDASANGQDARDRVAA
jgi:hypothetical protein